MSDLDTYSRIQKDDPSTTHKIDEKNYHDNGVKKYIHKYYRNIWWLTYRLYIRYCSKKCFKRGGAILDLGSGPIPSLLDTSIYDNGIYCCADISPMSLYHIKRTFKATNLNLVICDAEFIPFKSGSYDTVISFGLLHHLYSPEKCISEIHRVMNGSGYLISHEPSSYWSGKMESPHERGFSLTEICYLMRGFRSFRIKKHNNPYTSKIISAINRVLNKRLSLKYRGHLSSLLFKLEHVMTNYLNLFSMDYFVIARARAKLSRERNRTLECLSTC